MPDNTASSAAAAAPASAPAQTANAPANTSPDQKNQESKPAGGEAEPKFKVKVDGKEQEVSLADLQKHYGTFQAGQKALKESAELRKQAEEALGHIKKGTRDALRSAGLSDEQIRTIAIETLAEEHKALLEEERKKGLSDEQRELEDARQKLRDAEDEKKKLADEKKAGQVAQAKQAVTNAVIDTLELMPESLRRNEMMANMVFNAWAYVLEHPDKAKELGIDATPKGIHTALLKRHRELARELMAHAKDEELDEFLAPTVKGRLFKTQKAAAEAAAHPSLTSRAESRNSQAPQKPSAAKPRKHLIREITLGTLGLK